MDSTRRAFLGTAAATLPVALAGCSGGGADGEGTATATGTATRTRTDRATDTGAGVRVRTRSHPDLGSVLVDGAGMTLYAFENDSPGSGTSTCTGGCADAWPPLTVPDPDAVTAGDGVSADLGTIERSDGSLQVTANGWPLYYFDSDEAPGDAKGQGVNDVWWVLRPDGAVVEPDLQIRSHPEHGEILTDADGMTLYMFDRDTKGEPASACTDSCTEAWPPFTIDGTPTTGTDVTADATTFEREAGGTQVTANGWPLYYFDSDEDPGDAKGQGANDVWWVLGPDGTPVKPEAGGGGGGY